ncbi:hypothetical protein Tco_1218216 [Tanacetum coccineum]
MRTCSPRVFESAQCSFDVALRYSLERIVTASGPGFSDWKWRLATLPFAFGGLGVYSAGDVLNYAFLASRLQSAELQTKLLRHTDIVAFGPNFDDALCVFNTSMEIDFLSNPSEIAAPKLMKKMANIYFTCVAKNAESTFSLSHRQMALWKSQMEDHTSDWLRTVPISGLGQTMNACSRVFVVDIYGDHAVSCAGIIGIKHRHNIVRDTLVDICHRPGISAGFDVCVDLTGSSPLMQTGMADFVPGRVVIDVAQRKRASGFTFDDALSVFNTSMEIDFLSNPSEIAAPKLMKKMADIYFTRVTKDATMNGKTYRCVLCYRLGVPLFSVSKTCSACSKVFTGDIYGDHAVSCASIIEVDFSLGGGCDKALRHADILLYSWDRGLDVCVDLTGSSPLTRTGMADFVSGRAVTEVAQHKRVKYEAKCADIGYGLLPFSFSSFGELKKDAVTLLKRIQKFFMAQDVGARVAVHIFNRINFSIAKGVRKLPEHQAKSDELMLKFVTSLARKHAEEFVSDLFKIDNAARDQKLAATWAKSDKKRETKGVKSVAPGTAVTTGNVDKAAECDRIKARNDGSGRGQERKVIRRVRVVGEEEGTDTGRGCGGNNSRSEQIVDGGVVLKEGSQATTDSKDSVISDHLIDRNGGGTDLLDLSTKGFMELLWNGLEEMCSDYNGLNISTGRLAGNAATRKPPEIGLSSADAMKRSGLEN